MVFIGGICLLLVVFFVFSPCLVTSFVFKSENNGGDNLKMLLQKIFINLFNFKN